MARRAQRRRLLRLHGLLRHHQRRVPVSDPHVRGESDAEFEYGGDEVGDGVCDCVVCGVDWTVSFWRDVEFE